MRLGHVREIGHRAYGLIVADAWTEQALATVAAAVPVLPQKPPAVETLI
jgi:hypothetical protein